MNEIKQNLEWALAKVREQEKRIASLEDRNSASDRYIEIATRIISKIGESLVDNFDIEHPTNTSVQALNEIMEAIKDLKEGSEEKFKLSSDRQAARWKLEAFVKDINRYLD